MKCNASSSAKSDVNMRQKCRKSADIRHALPKPIHEDARGSLLAPIVLCQAFDTLFNKRDYARAETFWPPKYIQHSAHIDPEREGLFNLVKSSPVTLKYEPGLILADGDFVIVHGRFSGFGLPVN